MKELVYTSVTWTIGSWKVCLNLTVYTFDSFFLACYVHGFCTILGTENHILLDIKILRRSYKSIHGENLDIGLGNHLNP